MDRRLQSGRRRRACGALRADAVNHQVAENLVEGRDAIRAMFAAGFAAAEMFCIRENLFLGRRMGDSRMARPERATRLRVLSHRRRADHFPARLLGQAHIPEESRRVAGGFGLRGSVGRRDGRSFVDPHRHARLELRCRPNRIGAQQKAVDVVVSDRASRAPDREFS
jgi:hypothetical protein